MPLIKLPQPISTRRDILYEDITFASREYSGSEFRINLSPNLFYLPHQGPSINLVNENQLSTRSQGFSAKRTAMY